MKEKITVTELYDGFVNSEHKDIYLRKKLEIRAYVPFLVKNLTAENIAGQCFYNKEGMPHIDSARQHYLTVSAIINLYTNIDSVPEKWITEEYDLLVSSGIYDAIVNSIPEDEYSRFMDIISMKRDDIITNAKISKSLDNSILKIMNGLLGYVNENDIPEAIISGLPDNVIPINKDKK